MKKTFIIHPFLFAAFPVLALFTRNIEEVSFFKTLPPMAVVLGFTALLLLLFRLILKDTKKAAILVSIFLIFFFSYGHVFNIIQGWWQIKHRYIFPPWGIVFICITYFTIKTSKDLHSFTKILNVIATSLVIISLINIGTYEFRSTNWQYTPMAENTKIEPTNSRVPSVPRDIYYIIFDRYVSESTLKEVYNFDNSVFIDYLSNKGFYVASKSRSNYLTSSHSLASSLNMEYINYLSDKMGEKSNIFRPLYAMIQNNKILQFIKSRGYKYIHFVTRWGSTSRNKYADINFVGSVVDEFSLLLYQTTALCTIDEAFQITKFADPLLIRYNRILWKLNKIAQIPNIKEPTFTFAHMLIPHAPYVFDRNGNFLPIEKRKSEKENYIEQLIAVNNLIINLIEKLLSNSKPSPIIIIQADEGTHPKRYKDDIINFNWRLATEEELRQKTGILNAYYLPGMNKDILYPSITPVNSFRVIFNLYFNTNFELLPDESYAHESYRYIYKFFNVTDKVN